MNNATYYQRNREIKQKIIMNIIKKDYESMQEINIKTYLKKKKFKKREYERNRYHNMSEEKNKN